MKAIILMILFISINPLKASVTMKSIKFGGENCKEYLCVGEKIENGKVSRRYCSGNYLGQCPSFNDCEESISSSSISVKDLDTDVTFYKAAKGCNDKIINNMLFQIPPIIEDMNFRTLSRHPLRDVYETYFGTLLNSRQSLKKKCSDVITSILSKVVHPSTPTSLDIALPIGTRSPVTFDILAMSTKLPQDAVNEMYQTMERVLKFSQTHALFNINFRNKKNFSKPESNSLIYGAASRDLQYYNFLKKAASGLNNKYLNIDNRSGIDEYTPLMKAVIKNNGPVVTAMLADGANPTLIFNKLGNNAALKLAKQNGNIKMCNELRVAFNPPINYSCE